MRKVLAGNELETHLQVARLERRHFLKAGSGAVAAFAAGPFSVLTAGSVAAQTADKLQSLVPDERAKMNRPGLSYRRAEEWMSKGGKGLQLQSVELKEREITFEKGPRKSVWSLVATCETWRGNRLTYNGTPIQARYLAWSATNIYWQPGAGWPIFTTYCPDPSLDANLNFRDAERFQIVPVFGGYYWCNCYNPAYATGDSATDVVFWVNDYPGTYGDNAGTFEIIITGLST